MNGACAAKTRLRAGWETKITLPTKQEAKGIINVNKIYQIGNEMGHDQDTSWWRKSRGDMDSNYSRLG